MASHSFAVTKQAFRKLKNELNTGGGELRKTILDQLSYIGEQCVTLARQDHPNNWGDVTGNLRSSIGYVVMWDGQIVVNGGFVRKAGTKGTGEEGEAAGQALLQRLQSKFPYGAVLIIVAGMNYASYVESVHHKDVLSSAGLKAEQLVKELLSGIVEGKQQ